MKIIIVSDIHGNYLNMQKVIQNEGSFDRMFILGDILSGPYIDGYDPDKLSSLLNIFKNKILCVKGNCDRFYLELLEFPVEKDGLLIPVDNKLFYITHGHKYNKYNLPDTDFDVFIEGHTHAPIMEKDQDKVFLNPGSVSLPRRGNKSYLVYDNGVFILKEVDGGSIVKKLTFC